MYLKASEITEIVSDHFGQSVHDIIHARRTAAIIPARHLAMCLLFKYSGMSNGDIGDYMCKTEEGVKSGRRHVEEAPELMEQFTLISKICKGMAKAKGLKHSFVAAKLSKIRKKRKAFVELRRGHGA